MQPGLMVLHGDRPETLCSLLAAWLARHPLAPLEPEVLLVQSNGIAQWLRQALAAEPAEGDLVGGLGVAAALDMQLPARFLWRAYRAVLGAEAVPERSPLDQAPLAWRLMRLLPALQEQPEMAPLARYLADDTAGRKRYPLAQQLATVYDQYQVYRADWLADWAAGHDRLQTWRYGDKPLPDEQRWQAALWRALLADDGMADNGELPGRAGVHQRFLAAMRELAVNGALAPVGLPRRVVVFGIAALPAQTLQALAALASHVQVMLFIHNPCRYHWSDIVDGQELLRGIYKRQAPRPRAPVALDAAALHAQAHPLLAAWGKLGRDYLHLVDGYDDPDRYRDLWRGVGAGRIDMFSDSEPPPRSLLAQLQNDILELRQLAETRAAWPPVDPARDVSLRFHSAHTPQREVEVLHDQLLARFAADRSLQPRDVIVMAPDIEVYAPHIEAVFGRLSAGDSRYIPYSIADCGQAQIEPLLAALDALLHLPDGRCTVSDVLDLLEVQALRVRFGLSEDALPRIRGWVQGAAAHWGLDTRQRAAQGLAAAGHIGTWDFALQRLWLGYAAGEGGTFEDIAPYGGVTGLEAADLGPLGALIDALHETWQMLQDSALPLEWAIRLRALLIRFFDVADDRGRLLMQQLLGALEQWLADCVAACFNQPVPLAVARAAWFDALHAPGLHQRFLSGGVNCCTLLPMRSIPFRVVCLLGMNDGDFPRPPGRVDFDLMCSDQRPGDRSRQSDDRYLLLEAVLAAREQLYVSWIGHDAHDGTPRMPSVLIGQLRDHVAAGWRLTGREPDAQALLQALTTEHPLQPFSSRYFSTNKQNGIDGLYSYAQEWRAAHDVGPHVAFASVSPNERQLTPLTLTQLTAFFKQPAQAYFGEQLAVRFPHQDEESANDEPFVLQGLTGWALEAELRAALQPWCLAAPSIDAARAELATAIDAQILRLQREGRLPLAAFGRLAAQDLRARVLRCFGHYLDALAAWPGEESCRHPLRWRDGVSGGAIEDLLPPRRLPNAALGEFGEAIVSQSRLFSPAPLARVGEGIFPLLHACAEERNKKPSLTGGRAGKRTIQRCIEYGTVSPLASIALADGPLHDGKGHVWHRIAPYWPTHLGLQIAAGPTLTVLVSESGCVILPVLDVEAVRAHLAGLLCAHAVNVRTPLPVALRAALAFLTQGENWARKIYEGDGWRTRGERDRVPAAARLWPDFDALLSARAEGRGFAHWSEALYRHLVDALMPSGSTGRQPAVQEGIA
jgi:exodeoxyribonuclease V gamma subunit